MKKVFIFVILILIASVTVFLTFKLKKDNVNNIENQIEKPSEASLDNTVVEEIPEKFNDEYIETIPENSKSFIELLGDDQVILTIDEILNYNEEIKSKADMVYDLDSLIAESPETVVKGIIVKRANLRSSPTDKIKTTNGTSDKNQETELHVNTPVIITRDSDDGLWSYVTSPFYIGWVKKENIALASDEDFEFFIKNENFGIITDAMVQIEDIMLDMSVRLPYVGASQNGYDFILPKKDENGYVTRAQITLERDKAHIGYLPYTKKNLYIQAFKYEGVNYSWGGKDVGVDCSSYVGNVYRTFGFMFPRNTSSQNKSVGEIIYLNGKTAREKLNIIKDTYPSLLYQSGHVMIYLGQKDNMDYIIHASGKEMKVTVTELTEGSSYIKAIDRVVLIK